MAGRSRRDVGDGVLGAGADMTIALGPERLARLLVAPSRGFSPLVPGGQRRTARRTPREQVAQS
jgi:hypothetical protein